VREKDEKRKKKSKKGKGSTEDPQEIKLGKRVLAAVKKVAETVGGDAAQIENELVNKLKSASTPKAKLSEIFEGMTVEGEKTAPEDRTTSDDLRELETSRAARVHRLMKDMPVRRSARFTDSESGEEDGDQRRRSRRPPQSFSDQPQYYKVDLFGGRPLGIFDPVDSTKQPTEGTSLLKTWDSLYQKELKMLVTNPPANGFEEMILWTEQKKLWRFPIDNEQGLTEEAKYSFEDHVFLENQIESWCPPKGPVRNFMELVCVGLSKNSYLTVPEKREYLAWYQDYFKGKSAVLKQTGAGEVK
jgi:small subunit ribosomal protein S31